MFTITLPRADITSQQVAGALAAGLGSRYKVLPGMRAHRNPFRGPSPAEPAAIVVGNRVLWTQVQVTHARGQTEINVRAGGLTPTGFLMSTFGVVRDVRRVLRDAPGLSSHA